jgi:hypothetical protein
MSVLAFCAGPLLGLWLIPILVTPVVKLGRRSRLVPVAFSTGACALAAWVAYWVLWSAGFNDADSLRPYPVWSTRRGMWTGRCAPAQGRSLVIEWPTSRRSTRNTANRPTSMPAWLTTWKPGSRPETSHRAHDCPASVTWPPNTRSLSGIFVKSPGR